MHLIESVKVDVLFFRSYNVVPRRTRSYLVSLESRRTTVLPIRIVPEVSGAIGTSLTVLKCHPCDCTSLEISSRMFWASTASELVAASPVRLLMGGSPTTLRMVLTALSLVDIDVISYPKERGCS